MGDIIDFPLHRFSDVRDGGDLTPVKILEDLLVLAKQDQLVFLAVAATRRDGVFAHVEIGIELPEEDLPEEPV